MRKIRIAQQALKSIRHDPLRTFLMALGIIIGIFLFIVINSVIQGTKVEVMKKVRRHGLDTIMIRPGSGQTRSLIEQRTIRNLSLSDAESILRIRGVKDYTAVCHKRDVQVKYKNKELQTHAFGITPNWGYIRNFGVETGEFITDKDISERGKVCVIGQTVLQELFLANNPIGKIIRINNVPFTIKGVLIKKGASVGGSDRDNRVIIPLTTFSKRLFNQDYLDQIVVQVKRESDIQAIGEKIKSLLRDRHNLQISEPDDFTVRLPKDLIKRASTISNAFVLLSLSLSFISIIVGGIIIMNIMVVSVTERKREIGIRRTVGASKSDILFQFLTEAICITFIGGLAGLFFGLGVSFIIPLISDLPVVISIQSVLITLIVSLITGLFFGIKPALKAVSLDPIKAIQ